MVVFYNITHAADMDGVGCGVLTNVLAQNFYDETKVCIPVIKAVATGKDKLDTLFNNMTAESVLEDIRNEIEKEKIEISDDIYEIYFIITDVECRREYIEKLQEITSNIKTHKIKLKEIWHFDHHASNPFYGEPDYSKETNSVCVNTDKGMKVIDVRFNYYVNSYAHLFKMNMRKNKELFEKYGFFSEGDIKRSATFIYFKFLYEYNLLNDTFDRIPESLVRFVYQVSHADTYQFKEKEGNPVILPYPDAYSAFFKYKKSFYSVLNTFVNKGNWDDDYNAFGPGLTDLEYDIIKGIYNQRESDYKRAISKAKLYPFSFEGQVYFPVVFCMDDIDISYVGNRVCEEFDVPFALFLLPGDRIISMRSTGKVDVGSIAKSYGGGGHKASSGATLTEDIMITQLRYFWSSVRTLKTEFPDMFEN